MILIADSGASKTDWACISRSDSTSIRFTSQGYNPNYISSARITEDIVANLPEGFPSTDVDEIYFYGAGVTPLQYPLMEEILRGIFVNATTISIAMDTLASCRALLQNKPGFAAILGTGSNSCLYDGCEEGLNVDSCGFILGDEGSGAYLGKRMITDFLRRNMPADVYEMVGRLLCRDNDQLIDQIYTRPFPNRFCAQYAKFINEHLDIPYFNGLVRDAFRQFFEKIVVHYPDYSTYSFNAVGSVGYYFRPILEEVVAEYGMTVGNILKAPMEGLITYHLDNGTK